MNQNGTIMWKQVAEHDICSVTFNYFFQNSEIETEMVVGVKKRDKTVFRFMTKKFLGQTPKKGECTGKNTGRMVTL